MRNVLEKENRFYATRLKKIASSMDGEHKREVAKKIGVSVRLVQMYLNGYVGSVRTAQRILNACKENIARRIAKIKNQ